SGRPALSHAEPTQGAGFGRLRYSEWDGSAWQSEVVDATGGNHLWSSLRFTASGQARVAYYEEASASLKLAKKNVTSWSIETVDAGPAVGLYPSLAFDPTSGEPAISYYDDGNYHLKLARHSASGWTTETVDGSNQITGLWSSLAFDAAGAPSVGYYNGSTF